MCACACLCLARCILSVFLGLRLSTLFTREIDVDTAASWRNEMQFLNEAWELVEVNSFGWISFWCLAWDSRQILYSLRGRNRSGPGALT